MAIKFQPKTGRPTGWRHILRMLKRWWLLGGALLGLALLSRWLPGARLSAIHPAESLVKPGESLHLTLQVTRPWYDIRPVVVTFTEGLSSTPVATVRTKGQTVTWAPPHAAAYGVTARLGHSQASTAVEAGTQWTARPRYGFMSDFAPTDGGQQARFSDMARYHLNSLQFYDWMYTHANYLPPTTEFVDPLGRRLSKTVLLEKLNESHKHGMATMAYTAVYGAPKRFADQHPDWALYDGFGKPITFGDGFLSIMNPEAGSPWAAHMVSEYKQIITQLPFDGIHLDQYGDPKFGFRYPGGTNAVSVDVGTAFTTLIQATKAAVGDHPVYFNDVGAWSLPDTAATDKDGVYIEVWPPYVTFDHLHQLINRGREKSGGKPVVLAAYISPEFIPSVLLTDAVIFASGGSHLELGEGNNMLADPYFPKYKPISPALQTHLRQYYDVSVRYGDLLYAKDLQDWAPTVTMDGTRILPGGYFNGVWPLGRTNQRYQVLHLINLNGLEGAKWNASNTTAPPVLKERAVTVEMAKAPRSVSLIDPDGPDQAPKPVHFTYADGAVHFTVSKLAYWDLVVFER